MVFHDVDDGPIVNPVDLHLAHLLVGRIHDVAAVPLRSLLILLRRIRLLLVLIPSLLLDIYHGLCKRIVVLLCVRASYRTQSLGWRRGGRLGRDTLAQIVLLL